MLKIAFFAFFALGLFAKDVTLDFLREQPLGVVRDFYIWYFISKDQTSIEDAKKAYDLVFKKTSRIERAMEKKGIFHEMPRDLYCKKLDFSALREEDAQCIAYGLKLSIIETLKQDDIHILLQKLQESHVDLYEQVRILSQNDVATALMEASAKNVAAILGGITYVQKLTLLDSHQIQPKHLLRLFDANNLAFNRVMGNVILDPKFQNIKKKINAINVSKSDTNTLFLLGINSLMLEDTKKALEYFKASQQSASDPFMRDRALFWQYLITQDLRDLEQLQQSNFVDIFSIFANQKLKTTPKYTITSNFEMTKSNKSKFDIQNPFEWQKIRKEITQLQGQAYEDAIKQFLHPDTLPHYLYFLSRQHRYQYHYFIFAYDDAKMWRDSKQKALSYAIARQESNLLPALVSSSYALGMMQIMPFNVEPFAKDLGLKEISLFEMFNPKMALKFGSFYLDELKKEFKNPLFVAYAYNGGPGFLRRTLEKKRLFLEGRKYEPWISLELLPYEESRFYGMKVLANYIIYAQMLGEEIDLEDLLQQTLIYKEEKK